MGGGGIMGGGEGGVKNLNTVQKITVQKTSTLLRFRRDNMH